jgi:hypothetical protein
MALSDCWLRHVASIPRRLRWLGRKRCCRSPWPWQAAPLEAHSICQLKLTYALCQNTLGRVRSSKWIHLSTYNTIQESQVVAPPNRQVFTGAPCGSQEDLSPNMHSQAEHEQHTSGGKEGRGQRCGTRQAYLREPRSGAQGSTLQLQHTGYARIGGRSCIGELTLHRVRADLRRHQREDGTWGAVQSAPPQRQTGEVPLAR